VPFADLSIFQKIKMDMSRNKELKQYAAELQKQKELKAQIEREKIAEAARAAQYGPINYGRGSDGNQSYDSGQGFGTNATTGGPVSNKTGKGRTDYRYGGRIRSYFNGGLVSLRRR
jgi:hypothetical protein